MSDTGFKIRPTQRPRQVAMHQRENRWLARADPFEIPQAPEFLMGGGGLYGTAGDY